MASALNRPHFQNADKARVYLEALRWPNGPICPHCGLSARPLRLKRRSPPCRLWKCKDCREQFSVTVGTVFERSKIALLCGFSCLSALHLKEGNEQQAA